MRPTITPAILLLALGASAIAASGVDANHKYSWGENIGWMNWRDANAGAQGASMNQVKTFLAGFVWCENVGWVNLGDGTPTNGSMYSNSSGADFGVNVVTGGNLSGLAWGENIGWINFDTAAALGVSGKQARYDSAAKRFRGYAWGENIGWINLDDATNYVAITPPCIGDFNNDGVINTFDLGILLGQFGNHVSPGSVPDLNNDGVVNTFDLATLLSVFGTAC